MFFFYMAIIKRYLICISIVISYYCQSYLAVAVISVDAFYDNIEVIKNMHTNLNLNLFYSHKSFHTNFDIEQSIYFNNSLFLLF